MPGVQKMIKQMMTVIIVFRTFNSVRDKMAPVVAPVACCWTFEYDNDDDKEEEEKDEKEKEEEDNYL